MCDALVTPEGGNWGNAQTATVDEIGGPPPIPNVAIIRPTITPAIITINRNQYLNGAVILNEECQGKPPSTEDTTPHPEFKCQEVQHPPDDALAYIPCNTGWPTGVIIIWRP